MLIEVNPDEWESHVYHHPCGFHKANPGVSFAGCTCSGGYLNSRKEPKMDDYIEMPDYADRLRAAPVGECGRCSRKCWEASEIGTEDRMTQPDGFPCGGTFVQLHG